MKYNAGDTWEYLDKLGHRHDIEITRVSDKRISYKMSSDTRGAIAVVGEKRFEEILKYYSIIYTQLKKIK